MRPQFGDLKSEGQAKQKNPEETESGGSSLSLMDIVRMFTRHIWFILACVVVGFVIAKLYTNRLVPVYQATASFRMDPNRASSLGLGDLGGSGSSNDIGTELAIVKSGTVAIDVLNSLPDNVFLRYAGMTKKQAALSATSTNFTAQQEGLVGMFRSQLSASLVPGTQIVEVTFRHTDPEITAIMANYTVAAYLRQNFDSRYGSVAQVTKWLSTELDTLRDQAAAAQQRLSDFQEKNNIIATDGGAAGGGGGGGNTVTDRLTALNGRLTAAEEDRIVKEAQIRAANTGNPALLSSMFPGGHVTELEGEQVALNQQIMRLSTKFGPAYPPLIELKQQSAKVDDEIAAAAGEIKARLRQQLDNSIVTQNAFQQQYDSLTEKAYTLNRRQAEYAVLKAESASSRTLYNTLEGKLQQAGVEAGLTGINIMLVDSAHAPHSPTDLRKSSTISFGLLLGLFAGLATAFLRETLSEKVQNGEQLEQMLGYHLLAAIPHATSAAQEDPSVSAPGAAIGANSLVTLRDPMSRDAESYRSMRNSLLLASLDKPSQVLLITSTIPAEGKSSTTANYAVVLAQKGARVLVVDADLRRPTMHKQFGVKNLLGLSNLILGEEVPEPFLRPVPGLENLLLITAGKTVPFPSEALSSTKFYNLLSGWSKEFDYVILDSAPLLIVSDSLHLASWADGVILVTRYNVTPLGALRRIRALLHRSNVQVSGLIINDVSGTAAGYGGYGYGYGYYK
jgi:capsular exopolysaccharide synthesis family protein